MYPSRDRDTGVKTGVLAEKEKETKVKVWGEKREGSATV